jgi:Putative motility protein
MDMSLVMMAMALQAGKLQMQVATTMLKSNLDAEKSTVQTLLGTGGQNASPPASVAAGIGGNLDVTA